MCIEENEDFYDGKSKNILEWILNRYIAGIRRKKELEERLLVLDAERKSPIGGVDYDPMPHGQGGTGDGAAGILLKISDIEERIIDQKRTMQEHLRLTIDILELLPIESDEREVCELRYEDGKNWETISQKTNFSIRQCHRKKNDAIRYLLEFDWIKQMVTEEEINFDKYVALQDEKRDRRNRPQKRLTDYDEMKKPENKSPKKNPGK